MLAYLRVAPRISVCGQDAAVATLAVALYAGNGSEERLLAYLAGARTPAGAPLYDPHTALRVCRDASRLRVPSDPGVGVRSATTANARLRAQACTPNIGDIARSGCNCEAELLMHLLHRYSPCSHEETQVS